TTAWAISAVSPRPLRRWGIRLWSRVTQRSLEMQVMSCCQVLVLLGIVWPTLNATDWRSRSAQRFNRGNHFWEYALGSSCCLRKVRNLGPTRASASFPAQLDDLLSLRS